VVSQHGNRECIAELPRGSGAAADHRARFTAHSAFDDPTSPPDAPARESIEVRTLVFFPPQ
jgi:hypothetical protein